ncbi:MAG TPA: hypothetical protein VK971_04225 [Thiohalobacter sp.]|nr:hypothetical protein [Thiohalobacter sp.]
MSQSSLASGKARVLAITLLLGAASAGLYLLLYLYSDVLVELAARTRQGEKLLALAPLGVALVFSFVHGAFTGRFWELLGLQAKK